MQNITYKFLSLFFLVLGITLQNANCQDYNPSIKRADSLFSHKKYTESYKVYEQILKDQGLYSPGMLLKMAYIKEGLGDYTMALYFLNLYYEKTSNKETLLKMKQIASKYELSGYNFADNEYLLGLFSLNKPYFISGVVLCLLFVWAYFIHKATKLKKISWSAFIVLIFLSLLAFYFTNFKQENPKGLIINNHSYLMEAPSAGANLIEVIKKGHRVELLGTNDIWVKIKWKGQQAYLRQNHILTLPE